MADSTTAKGARFVLDSSGAGLQTTLDKSRVFLVKPSLGELEKLVGRKLDEDGVRKAATDIVARGAAEIVAVTMGVDGALLATSSGVLRVPAIPVRVRSAVGAGDSFLGAMVWALSQGKATEEAFRRRRRRGGKGMTPGTRLCKHSDVLDLFSKGHAG
jgi:6-phosphofructokinase 2